MSLTTKASATISPTFRTGGPGGPGAVTNLGYATATGVNVPGDGSVNTLASLVVHVPQAGMAVDVLFEANVIGSGGTGTSVEFICRVDGGAINDNASGDALDETIPYPALGAGEGAPWG